MSHWKPTDLPLAVAISSYLPTEEGSVPLILGDLIYVQSSNGDQLRGTVFSSSASGPLTGTFPASQLRYLAQGTMSEQLLPQRTMPNIVPDFPSMVAEIDSCLIRWTGQMKHLLDQRDYNTFNTVHWLFVELHRSKTLMMHQSAAINVSSILDMIEMGDFRLGFNLLIRSEKTAQIVFPPEIPAIQFLRTHRDKFDQFRNPISSSVRNPDMKNIYLRLHSMDLNVETFLNKLELLFFITSKTRVLSRTFRICIEGNLNSMSQLQHDQLETFFSNLSFQELKEDASLVIRAVRTGKLHLSDSKSEKLLDKVQYRRPLAVGIYPLRNLSPDIVSSSQGLFFWSNVLDLPVISIPMFEPTNENNFSVLHHFIMDGSDVLHCKPSEICPTVSLSICYRDARDKRQNVTTSLKPYIEDFMLPRNDIFFTLSEAVFPSLRRETFRNIQVKLEIRLLDGIVLPQTFFYQQNDCKMDSFHSYVLYHCQKPVWDETIRASVPDVLLNKAHLFITYRHCSSSETHHSEFGFSFLPLFRKEGLVTADGDYKLNVYRWDPSINDQSSYLKLDPGPEIPISLFSEKKCYEEVPPDKVSLLKDASLSLSLCLASTSLTQNIHLFHLLNPKAAQKHGETGTSMLQNFASSVNETEIILFFDKIVHVLFNLFDGHQHISDANLDELFSTLVFVLNVMLDRRFIESRKVLEEKLFKLAHRPHLWQSMLKIMSELFYSPEREDISKLMRDSIKIWHYLLRICVISKTSDNTQSENEELDPFIHLFAKVIDAILVLMKLEIPEHVIAAQSLAVQHFGEFIHVASQFASPESIVYLIHQFLGSIRSKKAILRSLKGQMMKSLLSDILLSKFKSQIIQTWLIQLALEQAEGMLEDIIIEKNEDQLSMVLSLINDAVLLLEKLPESKFTDEKSAYWLIQQDIYRYFPDSSSQNSRFDIMLLPIKREDLFIQTEKLMWKILNLLNEQEFWRHDSLEIYMAILGLFHLLPAERLLAESSKAKITVLLKSVTLLTSDILPKEWESASLFKFQLCLKILSNISAVLCEKIPLIQRGLEKQPHYTIRSVLSNWNKPKEMDSQTVEELLDQFMWSFLKMLEALSSGVKWPSILKNQVGLLESSMIQFLQQMKATLFNDDLRISSSGRMTFKFTPRLVEHFFRLAVAGVQRKEVIPLLLEGLLREYLKASQLNSVRSALILSMYEMTKMIDYPAVISELKEATVPYLRGLPNHLSFLVQPLNQELTNLFKTMDNFVMHNSKLFSMEQKSYVDLCFMQEDYVEAIEEIVEYISSVGLENLRPKLLQRLYDMHFQRDNFVEAAKVLQKMIDDQNRISLSEDVLVLLEKGKAWELAIETCKTLANHFEDGPCVDYGLASKYYTKLAELYRNIWNADPFPGLITDSLSRYHPQFYLVTFHGNGWNTSNQNKTMIYQAGEWERLDEFKRRILSQHPDSTFYRKEEWEALENRPQKAILISPLTPKSLVEKTDNLLYDLYQPLNPKQQEKKMPEKIRRSMEFSHYDVFVHSRQEKRAAPTELATDGLGEERQSQLINLLSTWTVISVFIPKKHFPGVHLRSEIQLTETFELSPLQTAILTLTEKNEQLNHLQKMYSKSNIDISLNPLTMAINGTVDALVNGGISLYRMAFLEANDSEDPLIERLKSLIMTQAELTHQCLLIHDERVSEELRPLHDNLVLAFLRNFSDEIKQLELKFPENMTLIDKRRFSLVARKSKADSDRKSANRYKTVTGAESRRLETNSRGSTLEQLFPSRKASNSVEETPSLIMVSTPSSQASLELINSPTIEDRSRKPILSGKGIGKLFERLSQN